MGFAAGYYAEEKFVRFSDDGMRPQLALRIAIGMAIVACLLLRYDRLVEYLKMDGLASFPIFWTLFRYSVVGLTAACAIPWLFVRTRLSRRQDFEF
jgi:hypothetical protein